MLTRRELFVKLGLAAVCTPVAIKVLAEPAPLMMVDSETGIACRFIERFEKG